MRRCASRLWQPRHDERGLGQVRRDKSELVNRDAAKRCIHTGTQPRLPEADPLVKQPRHATNGSTSENGRLTMVDLDLLAWLME